MSDKIETVSGRGIPLRGDDIDTDRIIPARYLRCVTFDGLGEHAFADDRKQNPAHVFNQDRYVGARILVAGRNFGCGSSREHAPQSLHRWGIHGIVAPSFAEIFFGNCNAIGVPCLTVSPAACETLWAAIEADPKLSLTLDVGAASISCGTTTVAGNIPAGVRASFLAGTWNATSVLLEAGEQIDRVGNQLPYVTEFSA